MLYLSDHNEKHAQPKPCVNNTQRRGAAPLLFSPFKPKAMSLCYPFADQIIQVSICFIGISRNSKLRITGWPRI